MLDGAFIFGHAMEQTVALDNDEPSDFEPYFDGVEMVSIEFESSQEFLMPNVKFGLESSYSCGPAKITSYHKGSNNGQLFWLLLTQLLSAQLMPCYCH